MTQVSSPDNSPLVIGHLLVYNDSDLPASHALAEHIQLVPPNREC